MKKIFVALFLVLLLFANPSICAEDYDISGLWHIKGTGFAEKSFVRSSLNLEGNLSIQIESVNDISDDITTLVSGEEEINFIENSNDILDSNSRKLITSYDINLKVTATELDIKAWQDHLENGIRIPVLLPHATPTNNNPYVLPAVTYDGLTYQITITSVTSGTVRIKGYVDLDIIGSTELNSDCAIWKDGSPEPSTAEESKSGCNFGFNYLCLAVIILGGFKFVRN